MGTKKSGHKTNYFSLRQQMGSSITNYTAAAALVTLHVKNINETLHPLYLWLTITRYSSIYIQQDVCLCQQVVDTIVIDDDDYGTQAPPPK